MKLITKELKLIFLVIIIFCMVLMIGCFSFGNNKYLILDWKYKKLSVFNINDKLF